MNFDYKKAVNILAYFAYKESPTNPKINKMKAIKLFFLADRMHLRKYGRLLCGGNYVGMEYGPVNSPVKDLAEMSTFLLPHEADYVGEYFVQDHYEIEVKREPDMEEFSKSDIEVLDEIWKLFGKFDQYELADITHLYPEWYKYKDLLTRTRSFDMDFSDFFENPNEELLKELRNFQLEDDPFVLDDETLKVTKEIAKEYGLINFGESKIEDTKADS